MSETAVIRGFAHLVHHNIHYEWCSDLTKRIAFIKAKKQACEIPTRLKWIAVIPDDLIPGKDSCEWQAYAQAGQVVIQTEQVYECALEAYYQAFEAYEQTQDAKLITRDAYYQTMEARDQATVVYDQALRVCKQAKQPYLHKFSKELADMHEKLFPGCPWDEKQGTMFPVKN